MKKVKKLINYLLFSFVILSAAIGGLLLNFSPAFDNLTANAELQTYDSIKNSLPDYFDITTSTEVGKEVGKVGDTIYLFQNGSYKNVSIGGSHTIANGDNANYAYIPDETNSQVYYYFDFQNSLSLYYNLTNEQIISGQTGFNLMQSQQIENYVQSNEKSFVPTNYNFTPLKLNIKFELNTANNAISFGSGVSNKNLVTLSNEGCYTLAIPLVYYYTDNGGTTFTSTETVVYYTFMIFNSNTYFNSTTGLPNLTASSNIQESTTTSSSFSRYYFYNYSYGATANTLPAISYNPNIYQLQISYTDIDEVTYTSVLEYSSNNKSFNQLDADGNAILEDDYFVYPTLNNDNNVSLYFTDIGTYDISLIYLYKSIIGDTETTYTLPLNNLENNTIFKNKNQRLYIYGYQTVYSDYSQVNEVTNQPESVELKSFDFKTGLYSNSADITSAVNNYIKSRGPVNSSLTNTDPFSTINLQNPSSTSDYDLGSLEVYIKEYINLDAVKPVSTNQTPIKFVNNVKNTQFSKIYKVTQNSDNSITLDNDSTAFEGFNQNTAGTYLYIIQYQYDYFMSTSGTLQSANYHYQIFYFTVTNTTPTVTILDGEYKNIYTSGYTNKNVYILNDAENNIYDAKVTILLSAKNYKTGKYYFQEQDIRNLSSFAMSYQCFEEGDNEDYNEKVAGKYGILIENTNVYANAQYTVKIKSANSDKPSVKTFTIDTNEISGITARNVSLASSTTYKIKGSFSSYNTNQPMIFSWNEKESGAPTYGYVRYIPLESINYYSSQVNQDNLTSLLSNLINLYQTLPVPYKINLNYESIWTEYKNSYDYNSTINATYVKTNNGFYILEVYDQAGNSSFELFLLEDSEPLFVKYYFSGRAIRTLMNSSESISVPETGEIHIEWAENKAIYLENPEAFTDIHAYQYGIDYTSADAKLKVLLENFFNGDNNSDIQQFSNLGAEAYTEDNDSGAPPTGISSYDGTYLIIPINDKYYIKTTNSDNFVASTGSSYKIDFIDEDTNKANEGTCKILLRDESNTYITANENTNYKNYPSSYISFNVTSDSSKMMIKYDNGEYLDWASYNLTGNLYNKGTNDNPDYTHLTGDEEGNSYTETELTYKFSYYTPINAKNIINLSFVPVAENGSKVGSIVLKYYPFERKYDKEKASKGMYYYYYDISSTAEKTITIYSSESGANYTADDEINFQIALGSTDFPKTGRYVIERTYVNSDNIDQYDYYKRTMTFNVDDYNLISSLEAVSNENGKSSLESVVGGDIILSMYSGENNSSIEISFPRFNENGLNTGSFYTQDAFASEDENLNSFAVEGNKLPMSLYIPKYKYTTSYTAEKSTVTNETTYSVENNTNLSFYGGARYKQNPTTKLFEVYVEDVLVETFTRESEAINYLYNSITVKEYEIFVEVIAKVKENNKDVYKYYYSNGNVNGGYLKLYEVSKQYEAVSIGATPVSYFYQTGEYVVTIYQANNTGSTGKFYNFYKFGFEILSSEPEFEIIGSDGYNLTETSIKNTYYTNSESLTIQWEVPKSDYEAVIDEEKITIKTFPQSATAVRSEIIDDENTKSFTLDCSGLVRSTNSYIEISMQYEGYNSSYYSIVTKRIYFDITAPTQNLQNLMTLTETATNKALTKNYQQIYMRKYYNYKNEEVTVNANTDFSSDLSYSYSIESGTFKYFSFNVSKNYFYNSLVNTINKASSYLYDTQFIYYRLIGDNEALNAYSQVDKSSFAQGNYINVAVGVEEIICGYYEIVELDYAGNMVVYLVYVIDSDDENDQNVDYTNALTYINTQHQDDIIVNDSDITTGYNIYSNSGYELIDINYKADPWAVFYIQIAGQSQTRYLKSPWLNDGFVYQMKFTSTGVTFTQVNLTSIFENVDSSSNKHVITLSNRLIGYNETIYLSIMDASLNTSKVEDVLKTSAILNISVPTVEQQKSTTTSYVYPENITIYQFDSTSTLDDKWKVIMDASQFNYGTWTPTDEFSPALSYISFTTITPGNILQVKINLGSNASQKVKYVITDNFGNVTTIIQLANEVAYNEIGGDSTIYTIAENDGSVTYISDQTIRYSFNTLLYTISIYDKDNNDITNDVLRTDNSVNNISYYSLTSSTLNNWDNYYRILVKDSESNEEIKTIHARIYYKLPYITNSLNEVANGGIVFNDKNQNPLTNVENIVSKTISFEGKSYTASAKGMTTYSQNVTLYFRNGDAFDSEGLYYYQDGYGYGVYLSKDNGLTWVNINSATSATSGHTLSGVGEYLIFIKYNSDSIFTNLCSIYQVTILDSSSSYYYITVDGLRVEKNDIRYTDVNNVEYQTNYIVGVDYSDKNNRLKITENEELDVKVQLMSMESTGTNVYVEIYYYSCSESVGYFTIIYIEETDNIVSQFTYETASGTTTSLKSSISEFVVANKETENNFTKLKLNFTSSYGISQNKINIEVLKLFNGSYVEIYPTVYENGDASYVYLEKAGSYRVRLYDSCTPANVQTFKNRDYVDIIFLNATPLTVTYTDVEGNEVVSEFVQKAVYNNSVKLSLTNLTTYYQPSGYPIITVKRNGVTYHKQTDSEHVDGYIENNNTYTFSQPGFYTVSFSSTSTTGIAIREEEFNFTILNKNESRYAYEFTNFNNYYISKVIKDEVDITEDLLNISNFDTIMVGNKEYMSELIINYLDEKTGGGRYRVTVSPNNSAYINTTGDSFTFDFWINMATPPINVSISEGSKTTGNIYVRFNIQNLYNAVGDCYLVIGNTTRYYTSENLATYKENQNISILNNGTFFVQIYTTGGHLLYSYKVTKSEPLNAFAIIAIIVGVIIVAVIIIITIRLRKRQKVK